MNTPKNVVPVSSKTVQCPYCKNDTSITVPSNYAPVYVYCEICGKVFIAERLAKRIQVLTWEEAPYCGSDPDCLEIEMGASDEQ